MSVVSGTTLFFLVVGMYILSALIYQSIYRKAGHSDPWLAWIPIANMVPLFQLGGISAWWLLLLLVPFVNWIVPILAIICLWRVFKIAGYNGALSLLTLLPIVGTIMLMFVAWEKPEYPNRVNQ